MATAPMQPSQLPVRDAVASSSRTLALSLVWGGCMLFILGLWIGSKHEDLPRVCVLLVWLLAAISFACGIWQYITVARTGTSAEQKHVKLVRQRQLLGVVLIVGGLSLIGLGFYLGISYRLAAFGEVVGTWLLGLCAALSGARLIKGQNASAEAHPVFDLLRRQNAKIGIVMLGAGFVLGLTALGLILIAKLGHEWFPEMAGLLLLGFVGIGAGFWLTLARGEELTTAKMRIFVLVVGGVVGLILSLGALTRAILWRSEVFGGMRAWQGDRAWHLWLCAYVELIGLALMFASLLLARTDIRSSAVLRRVLYGYNAVLTGLLLLAVLVVINIVVFALFPFSFEWSKSRGAHTLSPSSKNLLDSLRAPTTIYVLLPNSQVTEELKNFFDNCQYQSQKLQVKYVSPDKDFEEYKTLAKHFPDSLTGRQAEFGSLDRGILVVYGEIPSDPDTKVPHAFIKKRQLVEVTPSKEEGVKGTRVFKGESEVMKELSFLAQGRKKRKLYFLQGDGELDINLSDEQKRLDLRSELAPLGCATLVEVLKKNQYEVQGLSFAEQLPKDKTANMVYAKNTGPQKRPEVPEDADAVIIAGPSTPLAPKAIEALERYMDRGGKLLVYLDIVLDAKESKIVTTGMEDFLRKYGVLVGVDFPLCLNLEDPREVVGTVPRDSTNELARSFLRYPFQLRTARIVRPDPSASKYKAEIALQLDRREPSMRFDYVVESDARALLNPAPFLNDLNARGVLVDHVSAEPVPVAAVVSEKLLDPGSGKENLKPRLLVFGDAECISNYYFVRNPLAFYWTASALEWMAEKQGLIGPRDKETSTYTLNPLTVNVGRMQLLPGWLMMLGIFGLGAGIWVVRRR